MKEQIWAHLSWMDDPLMVSKARELLKIVEKKGFFKKPAAKSIHHAYEGGLAEHTLEVMELASKLNELLDRPYSTTEVLLAAFIHDFDKLYAYHLNRDGFISKGKLPASGSGLTQRLCAKVGMVLPVSVISAVEFAHGGWSDLADNRMIKPCGLHAIIHSADMLSTYFGKNGGVEACFKE